MKVRITSEGHGRSSRVVNLDTGEDISTSVRKATIVLDAADVNRVDIEMIAPQVDVVAEVTDWRRLYIQAVRSFEEERPGMWIDIDDGVDVPELRALREARA